MASNPKLSYIAFKEIYGDLGVTHWVKYNWLNVHYTPIGPVIPDAYQEVEYLQSSGTQAINTGLLLSGDNYKVETKYNMDYAGKNANALFGAQYQNPLMTFYADKIFCYGNPNETATNRSHTGLLTNQLTEVSATFNNGTVNANINGNTISYNAVTNFLGTHFANYPMYLFTNNNGGTTTSQNFKGKLYRWKISQNDVALRNMIPCYRKFDNVAGMFDITKSGKNLINIPESTMTASYNIKTLTADEINEYIGKTLTLSCYVDNIVSEISSCWAIYVVTDQGNYVGNWLQQEGGRTSVTFNLPSNSTNVRFVCNRAGSGVTSGHIYNIQLEESSTATDYEECGFYTNKGTGTFTPGPDIN